MLVTFFYALDRSTWPAKWNRSVQDYYERFEQLLLKLHEKPIIVFSNDTTIQKISQKYFHCHYVEKPIESFRAWNEKEIIHKCLEKRWFSFNVPEFFSPDYIALQLCKFEALHLASLYVNDPQEPIIWIDAGIRQDALETQFHCVWKNAGIHVTQFTALPICEALITAIPGAFLMGGCFGGFGVHVRRLFQETQILLQELYANNQCANDQQILSILYWRKPQMFHVQKAYKQVIPFYGTGRWNRVLQILDSEDASFEERYDSYVMLAFIGFLLYLKFK